jgi:hypothetical protein
VDPRRELAALQVAATQALNAQIAAAAAAISADGDANGVDVNGNANGDFSGESVVGGHETENGIGMNGDGAPVPVPVPVPAPITATKITPQGIFAVSHNPRSANRINLLSPHTGLQSSSTSTSASIISTTAPGSNPLDLNIDGVSTYVPCVSTTVSPEGVRVLSLVNVMESWRSKVQTHAVRLMNRRGK